MGWMIVLNLRVDGQLLVADGYVSRVRMLTRYRKWIPKLARVILVTIFYAMGKPIRPHRFSCVTISMRALPFDRSWYSLGKFEAIPQSR